MGKIRAAITGIDKYIPEDILTNKDLEKLVDTNDEWITTRTGIKERHVLKDKNVGSSFMGAEATKKLLKKTNTNPDDIDMIICATITPDRLIPSCAAFVADLVGIKNAFAFDINAACSGFVYALATAQKFVESGSHKKVLIVAADKMTSITDYSDRATCILFGDAGAAALVEPTTEDVGVMDNILGSDGAGRHHLYQVAGGSENPPTHETIDAKQHYIRQEGQTVFKYAVSKMAQISVDIMERNNLSSEDVNWLVPHQANLRIIDATARRTGLDPEKVTINIEKYGNTTAATIPLCLCDWEKKFKKGDNIILTAFGGGFTWGSTYLKWAYDTK